MLTFAFKLFHILSPTNSLALVLMTIVKELYQPHYFGPITISPAPFDFGHCNFILSFLKSLLPIPPTENIHTLVSYFSLNFLHISPSFFLTDCSFSGGFSFFFCLNSDLLVLPGKYHHWLQGPAYDSHLCTSILDSSNKLNLDQCFC